MNMGASRLFSLSLRSDFCFSPGGYKAPHCGMQAVTISVQPSARSRVLSSHFHAKLQTREARSIHARDQGRRRQEGEKSNKEKSDKKVRSTHYTKKSECKTRQRKADARSRATMHVRGLVGGNLREVEWLRVVTVNWSEDGGRRWAEGGELRRGRAGKCI